MTNLLSNLSEGLKMKLADFKVESVFVVCGEVFVESLYDMDITFYQAIERELNDQGFLQNESQIIENNK